MGIDDGPDVHVGGLGAALAAPSRRARRATPGNHQSVPPLAIGEAQAATGRRQVCPEVADGVDADGAEHSRDGDARRGRGE
eukprot:7380138-Prymnesium_polylepis.2